MQRSRSAPFIMYRLEDDELEMIIILQVDDSLGIGTE